MTITSTKLKRRRIILIALSIFLLLLCGSTLWVVNVIRHLPLGMMGGDCPESSSYGNVSITGNVINNTNDPNAEIHIVANKPKGGCPQSEEINNQEMVVHGGDKIATGYGMHLGDPNLVLMISATGFDSCELRFSSNIPSEDVDWRITLGLQLIVEQKTVVYGYISDTKGNTIRATEALFGSPSYQQVCPKVN
jgi:hypothetical protein